MTGKHWQRQGLRQKNNDDFGPEKTKRNDEEQIRLFLNKLQQNLKKIPQVPQTSPIWKDFLHNKLVVEGLGYVPYVGVFQAVFPSGWKVPFNSEKTG